MSGRRVAGVIRSLVNARDLQLQCARVLHETLLVPILMYGRDNVMNNLRRLLGIRRMDTVQNSGIRELCRVAKGVDERID